VYRFVQFLIAEPTNLRGGDGGSPILIKTKKEKKKERKKKPRAHKRGPAAVIEFATTRDCARRFMEMTE